MAKKAPRLLVFDSGVGGLSIFDALAQKSELTEFLYLADNGYFPYGDKADDALVERISSLLHNVFRAYDPQLLVMACNTASTIVLPRIRSELPIPVVGVVPAIKPAAKASKTKVIGLVATPATINRPYTDQLIKEFAAQCRVLRLGSGKLVAMAEARLRGESVDMDELKEILAPLIAAKDCDAVVLGCTHFPFLIPEMEQAINRPMLWLDSASAVADQVVRVLNAHDLLSGVKPSNERRVIFTADSLEAHQLEDAFTSRGFKDFVFGLP